MHCATHSDKHAGFPISCRCQTTLHIDELYDSHSHEESASELGAVDSAANDLLRPGRQSRDLRSALHANEAA